MDNFTPVENVTELQIIDIKEGNGPTVQNGDTITAHYTGAVAATGQVFQSSKDIGRPISFSLDQVIKGWVEGVPGMKVNGIRRLVIPSEKAYGSFPPAGSGIPADAALVFDIELVSID
jgi:FKBP-type peptidyl-prolyl cis-trans isomerase